MNVLIVDDHPTNLKLLRAQLEAEGHAVLEACDGVEALESLNRQRVDTVISDILMPRMDGYRLCHEIRKHARLRDLPIIIYTSTYTSPGDEKLALDVGADKYLTKPAPVEAIVAALHDVTIRSRVVRPAVVVAEADVLKEYNVGLVAKLAEKNTELIAAEAKFRSLVELSIVGIYIIQDDRFAYVNPRMTEIFGWSEEQMTSRTIYDFILPEDHALVRENIRRRISGEVPGIHYYLRMLHQSGTVLQVEAHGRLADYHGRPAVMGTLLDTTERKRSEANLQESETRFRQLAENVSEVFWITDPAKNQMLYISPAYETIWGRSCESLYQSPLNWLEAIDPDDRKRVVEAVAKQSRGTYDETYRIRHADGTLRWIHDRAFPVRDGQGHVYRIVGVAEDITNRKRAELRTEVQYLVTGILAEAASLPETMTRILEVICRRLDWDVGEVWMLDRMSKQLRRSEIWHPPSTEFREFADASSKTVYAMEEGLPGQVWASGEPIWIPDIAQYTSVRRLNDASRLGLRGAICFPIKIKGEVHGAIKCFSAGMREPDAELLAMFVALGTQVGQFIERKQLEKQFLQAQKMEAIGTMAGGIAHDFNNILAAINGHAELARMDSEGNPGVMESLDGVLKASRRATDLVRQILTFSRSQEQKRGATQLRHVVDEALKLLRASIPSTIQFKPALATNAPVVLADPSQIHQVIMNLCTNAWHAMKDRPGRLTVILEKLNVDPDLPEAHQGLPPGLYAHLSVSDTGKGMDKATLDHIFEPFFTTKAPGEGTGLGLSVVHGIVQSHDGVITVQSQLGEGTTFDLYFPAFIGDLPEAKEQSVAIPRGNGERILLVDDEEPLVRLGKMMLERLGYRVEIQTKPGVALALVRNDPQRVDLVITDLTMPEMTGIDLARHLLQIRPDLPVILTTGYSAGLKTESIRELRIRELLIKPLAMESLGTAVHRVLAREKTSQAPSGPLKTQNP